MTTRIIVRDRFYIPREAINIKRLRELFEVPLLTKENCHPGCPLAMKVGRYCARCPSKDARIKMWEPITTSAGRDMIAVPAGNMGFLRQIVRKYELVDRRSATPFRSNLRWTGKLYKAGDLDSKGRPRADQLGMLRKWIAHVNSGETGGVVISPPRSGKTVIGVAASLAHRVRTLITASEINFLRQFGMRYGENTNIKTLVRNGKSPVVLVDPKGWPDGPRFGIQVVKKWGKETDAADIVLCSYQQLIGDTGRVKLAKFVVGKFGKIIIDETHMAAAKAFTRVVNRTNVRYRLGLTATLHRKDGLHPVVTAVLGDAVAKGKAVSTLPDLEMFETGIQSPRVHSTWNGIVAWLSASEDRNKLIVRQIFKDLRTNPKACVLVPLQRVAHVHALVKMINTQAAFNRQNRGENWPKELAVAYYGKSNTAEVLSQINAGKIRVVVANTRMVQHGLDIARWTHVYVGCIPTSNPMLTWQLVNRVCTPYTNDLQAKLGDKPQPVARLMIDSLQASIFCFKRVFEDKLYGYKAGLNGTNFIDTVCYKATPQQLDRMITIAKFPKSYSVEDVGGKHVLGKTRNGKARTKHTLKIKRPITKF